MPIQFTSYLAMYTEMLDAQVLEVVTKLKGLSLQRIKFFYTFQPFSTSSFYFFVSFVTLTLVLSLIGLNNFLGGS